MVIRSPCKKKCKLDKEKAYCTGCGRLRTEIEDWDNKTDAQKVSISLNANQRLQDVKDSLE